MKRKILTLLSLIFASSVANAVPCGNMMNDVKVATYDFSHAPPSQRKALLQAAFQRTQAPDALKMLFTDVGTITNTFSVVDTQFTSDASLTDIALLRQFSFAATVSLNKTPDQCVLVWFSPDNQLVDVNVIQGIDAAGTLSLGSNDRTDSSVFMVLTSTL